MQAQQALASAPPLSPGEAGRHEICINGRFQTDCITYYNVCTFDGQQQWLVTRRYNDFLTLQQRLRGRVPLPPLPPKSVVRKLLSSRFADRRQQGLLNFLQAAVRADPGLQLLPQLLRWLGLPELRPPLGVGLTAPQPGSAQQPFAAQAAAVPTQAVAAATPVYAQAPDPMLAQPAYAQQFPATAVPAPVSAVQPTHAHLAAAPTPVYAQPAFSQSAVPGQPVYAQPAYAQPAYAQPAYAQPAPAYATPAYAQTAYMASPAYTTPVYQQQDRPNISPAVAALGAGAAGLVGGMLIENALEHRHHGFMGGGGFGPGGPGIFGSEEVIRDVRMDAFGDTETRTEVIDRDMFGNIDGIREQIVDRDAWGDVTRVEERFQDW